MKLCKLRGRQSSHYLGKYSISLLNFFRIDFNSADFFIFFSIQEDAFLVGPNLLVAPVLYEGATNVVVTLPGNDLWYDYTNYASTLAPAQIDVHADLDSIPVFYRGGSIIPSKHRIRRSSVLARDDPLTLIIAPNKNVSPSF